MKTIKLAGIVITAMLLSTKIWAQDAAKETLTVALSEPGKPYKLNVDILTGSITMVGYEGKDIVIDAQIPEKRKHPEPTNGMKRLGGGGNLDVSAEEKNNNVTVNTSMLNNPVNLIIKVPKNNVTLKLSTVNDGNISVSDVSGELEISNTNGGIKMTGISGSVVANTVNGPVTIVFNKIDPKAPMAFTSLNGKIDVTFPAGLKANVKLKTDHGDIYTDFDVMTDQRKPVTTHSAKDGMYSLKMEDWVYGKIDGGGPEMMMKTFNGSIYIRKAK